MRVRVLFAGLAASALLVAGGAHAQGRSDLGPALDAFVRRALDRTEAMPGLSVAVVDDRGLIHAAGFGVADVESPVPVTVDTPFYIAS
ncbi:MAG: serine hydrolase, partial [Brevundimonas sp.]